MPYSWQKFSFLPRYWPYASSIGSIDSAIFSFIFFRFDSQQRSEAFCGHAIRPSPAVYSEYEFQIGRNDKEAELEISFIDTAGEHFGEQDKSKKFDELLSGAGVAVLVIDSVELMLGEEISQNDKRNKSDVVHQHIKNWLRVNSDQPKLLCLVPVKTETWLRKRTNHNDFAESLLLKNRVFEEFDKTIRLLNTDSKFRHTVALAYCPVQTCGNLIFEQYLVENEATYPTSLYQKIRGLENPPQSPEGYAPLDCDQPLRIILGFYLNQYRAANHYNTYKKVPDWLRNIATLVGLDDTAIKVAGLYHDIFKDPSLVEAIDSFKKGIKSETKFPVFQAENLIF